MFSSSKRLERGWRVLVRIITFLLHPFERKKKNVHFHYIWRQKFSFRLYIFDSEDFHGSLLLDDFMEVFYYIYYSPKTRP